MESFVGDWGSGRGRGRGRSIVLIFGGGAIISAGFFLCTGILGHDTQLFFPESVSGLFIYRVYCFEGGQLWDGIVHA